PGNRLPVRKLLIGPGPDNSRPRQPSEDVRVVGDADVVVEVDEVVVPDRKVGDNSQRQESGTEEGGPAVCHGRVPGWRTQANRLKRWIIARGRSGSDPPRTR